MEFISIWRVQQQYDEKNIRRRVYDALNVLMAMDIISKDKKEIQWRGLPRTSMNDIEELKVCVLLQHTQPLLCLLYPLIFKKHSLLENSFIKLLVVGFLDFPPD